MYVVFHSNFAAYIVWRNYKPCEFPGFVWTDCWGNKSYHVITSRWIATYFPYSHILAFEKSQDLQVQTFANSANEE